jgi:DNA polymerase-1
VRKIVLVDGNGILYRSYFAIPHLSTRSGQPTNAVFGFVRAMKGIEAAQAPTHWLVVFDGGVPRERRAMLAEYKAQRPPMPDGLRVQVPIVEEYLACAGIPWLRMAEQEADDVLASIASRAVRDDADVFIVTSDKDMYQLVTDRIRILPPSGKGDPMGPGEVRQKTGVAPERVVDWLALVGDASDNIPGVPGVGPKTAVRLIDECGGLDRMWGDASAVKSEKLRAVLTGHQERIRRNAALVRLRLDLPCPWEWDHLERRAADTERLAVLFRTLEFTSMVAELQQPSLQISV